jgi:hypothetical protein
LIRSTSITVSTRGKGLYPFTRQVEDWLSKQGMASGLLTLFVQHTSCSLVIQENADPMSLSIYVISSSAWCLRTRNSIAIRQKARMT